MNESMNGQTDGYTDGRTIDITDVRANVACFWLITAFVRLVSVREPEKILQNSESRFLRSRDE